MSLTSVYSSIFSPSYTSNGGAFTGQINARIPGNVEIGDSTTTYSLKLNGSNITSGGGGGGDPSNWANYVAVNDVRVGGFDLTGLLKFNGLPVTFGRSPDIIAIGSNATESNAGSNVIAFGNGAASSNKGSDIVALGRYAGSNSSGDLVTSIGYFAGVNNKGSNVLLMGNSTGLENRGSSNVFIGELAGQNNLGSNTTGIGYNAAYSNAGNNCVYIGNNPTNNTYAGNNLFVVYGTGTTPLLLGNTSNTQLAIGTSTLSGVLNVGGAATVGSLNSSGPIKSFGMTSSSNLSGLQVVTYNPATSQLQQNSNITVSGGFVGIGLQNPAFSPLDVSESIRVGTDSNTHIYLGRNGTRDPNYRGLILHYGTDMIIGNKEPGSLILNTDNSFYKGLSISPSGYIGMGTTNAEFPLQIYTSATGSDILQISNTAPLGYATINLKNASNVGASLGVAFADSNFAGTAAGRFYINHDGVEAVTISAGRVGIRTSTPAYTLDVAGTARIGDTLIAGGRPQWRYFLDVSQASGGINNTISNWVSLGEYTPGRMVGGSEWWAPLPGTYLICSSFDIQGINNAGNDGTRRAIRMYMYGLPKMIVRSSPYVSTTAFEPSTIVMSDAAYFGVNGTISFKNADNAQMTYIGGNCFLTITML